MTRAASPDRSETSSLETSSKARLRFPLRLQVLGLMLLLSVPLVVGLSTYLMQVNQSAMVDAQRALHLTLARSAHHEFDRILDEARTTMSNVALALSDPSIDAESRIPIALTLASTSDVLDGIAIYDADGGLIDILNESDDGVESDRKPNGEMVEGTQGERNVFREQLEQKHLRQLNESDWTIGNVQGKGLPIALGIPIEAQNKITGYVMARMNSKHMGKILEETLVHNISAQASRAFVVDAHNKVWLNAGEKSVNVTSLERHPLAEGIDLRARHHSLTRFREFQYQNAPIEVGSLMMHAESGWGIIVATEKDVAYASLTRMRERMWITLGLAAVFALLLSLLFARYLTAPLQRLIEMTSKLASRDFSSRVEIRRSDEWRLLGKAMNRAAFDLKESEDRLREESRMRSNLGRFLPKPVVDNIVAQRSDLELGGQRRRVTIMFADVVSFTPLAERLKPEQTVAFLNELFTVMTEIVFRNQGVVDKFMGDSVMAFWGAPNEDDHHEDHALKSAKEILRFVKVSNREWKKKYDVEVQIAIGLNTGYAVLGNLGSETRMDYTVIGECVNVAARLESVARPGQVLLGHDTHKGLNQKAGVQAYGEHRLPGMGSDFQVYALTT